ncbi:hypothetical protein D3C72_1784720 [compost metagenome]
MPPITTANTASGPSRCTEWRSFSASAVRPSRMPATDGRHTQIARIVSRNSTVMIAPGRMPAMYSRAAEVLVIEP